MLTSGEAPVTSVVAAAKEWTNTEVKDHRKSKHIHVLLLFV